MELKEFGLAWGQAQALAKDKTQWKRHCCDPMPHWRFKGLREREREKERINEGQKTFTFLTVKGEVYYS